MGSGKEFGRGAFREATGRMPVGPTARPSTGSGPAGWLCYGAGSPVGGGFREGMAVAVRGCRSFGKECLCYGVARGIAGFREGFASVVRWCVGLGFRERMA